MPNAYKDTGFSLWIAKSDPNYNYQNHSAFQNIFHFIKYETPERNILIEKGTLSILFGVLKVTEKEWIRYGLFQYDHGNRELWLDPTHPELESFEFVPLKRFTLEKYRDNLSRRFQENPRCDLGLGEDYIDLLSAFKEAAKLQGENFLPTKLTPRLMKPLFYRQEEEPLFINQEA